MRTTRLSVDVVTRLAIALFSNAASNDKTSDAGPDPLIVILPRNTANAAAVAMSTGCCRPTARNNGRFIGIKSFDMPLKKRMSYGSAAISRWTAALQTLTHSSD